MTRERSNPLLHMAIRARQATGMLIAMARQARRQRPMTVAAVVHEPSLEANGAALGTSQGSAAPDRIPLSWVETPSVEEVLDEAHAATRECASACADGAPLTPYRVRGSLAAIAAVSSLAADLLEDEDARDVVALGLCVRIIESSAAALDEAGRSPTGLVAASAARRCAERCSQALLAVRLQGG